MSTRHDLVAALKREPKPERMTDTDLLDARVQAMRSGEVAAFTALRRS